MVRHRAYRETEAESRQASSAADHEGGTVPKADAIVQGGLGAAASHLPPLSPFLTRPLVCIFRLSFRIPFHLPARLDTHESDYIHPWS